MKAAVNADELTSTNVEFMEENEEAIIDKVKELRQQPQAKANAKQNGGKSKAKRGRGRPRKN